MLLNLKAIYNHKKFLVSYKIIDFYKNKFFRLKDNRILYLYIIRLKKNFYYFLLKDISFKI